MTTFSTTFPLFYSAICLVADKKDIGILAYWGLKKKYTP